MTKYLRSLWTRLVLPRIAVIVLVLPHSNASLERLFSIIRKNKTDMRSSLKLDGTLSSILSMKTHNPESRTLCFKWRPDQDLLELSRQDLLELSRHLLELSAFFLQDLVGG